MPSFVLSYVIGLVFSLAFAYLGKNGCASLAASVAAFQPLHSAMLSSNLLPRLRKVFSFVRRAPQATAVDVNRGVVYEDPSRRQDFSVILVLILAVQLQLLTSVLTALVSLEDSGESPKNVAEKEGAPPVDQIHHSLVAGGALWMGLLVCCRAVRPPPRGSRQDPGRVFASGLQGGEEQRRRRPD
ncbi:hypothetical protein K438DRAFT_1804433 [Mycena galopus ATCC 62051]|nr:hypothetical protein K438DRAFT_1804433 [Mycena galopus ATCC 62051]